jgi:hypothetical protein
MILGRKLAAFFAALFLSGVSAPMASTPAQVGGGFAGGSQFPPECGPRVAIKDVRYIGKFSGNDRVEVRWGPAGPSGGSTSFGGFGALGAGSSQGFGGFGGAQPSGSGSGSVGSQGFVSSTPACFSVRSYDLSVELTRIGGRKDSVVVPNIPGTVISKIIEIPRGALEGDPALIEAGLKTTIGYGQPQSAFPAAGGVEGSGIPAMQNARLLSVGAQQSVLPLQCQSSITVANLQFVERPGGNDTLTVTWQSTAPSRCILFCTSQVEVEIRRGPLRIGKVINLGFQSSVTAAPSGFASVPGASGTTTRTDSAAVDLPNKPGPVTAFKVSIREGAAFIVSDQRIRVQVQQ